MNSKRRADLQRKLSMGAVPRPPAGLADRIKADIPKHLEAHPSPEQRFPWSNTMRIAASILLLLTTALVTREMLEPSKGIVHPSTTARVDKVSPAVMRYETQPQAADSATQTRAESEVSFEVSEELPRPTAAPASVPPPAARRERIAGDLADAMQETTAASADPPVQIAEAAAPPPPRPVMAVPPAPTPAPAPAPPGPETATARIADLPATRNLSRTDTMTITASAPAVAQGANTPAVAKTAQASEMITVEPTSVFGISIDPAAFPTVRGAIETGERPAPGIVDVEALVNYFAGAKDARGGVQLEVEASPAPVAMEGDRAILRFTVDTSSVYVRPGSTIPPVARNARLHVDIDPRAVATFRRIGEGDPNASEDALLHNTSVTGLYELSLKSNLRSAQRVATVTLRYVSVDTGQQRTESRVIRGKDLARSWDKASRRHRLAALGALWSETLKGTNGGPEIAKRAEELATQNPRDSRARELANAANASTGGER
jgi:hypothetical protein